MALCGATSAVRAPNPARFALVLEVVREFAEFCKASGGFGIY